MIAGAAANFAELLEGMNSDAHGLSARLLLVPIILRTHGDMRYGCIYSTRRGLPTFSTTTSIFAGVEDIAERPRRAGLQRHVWQKAAC